MIFVIALACLFVALFILVEIQEKPLLALFLKGLASFGFLMVFAFGLNDAIVNVFDDPVWFGYFQNDRLLVAMLFALGLVCGLLGDLYLGLRPLRPAGENERIIMSGITAFSLGHIFYYVALVMIGGFTVWAILFSVIVTILFYVGSDAMDFKMGKVKLPSLFYSGLIFLMVGQAIFNTVGLGLSTYTSIVLAGALLFAISDLILAPIYFKGETRKGFVIANLSTYYAAQILIALSVMGLFTSAI
ncbi:MAG: lysoplasmalogenase [Acholeplasmataceae bacterium]|nr:lysoplasmalogenase [Acholeplasmataceae bacterium]